MIGENERNYAKYPLWTKTAKYLAALGTLDQLVRSPAFAGAQVQAKARVMSYMGAEARRRYDDPNEGYYTALDRDAILSFPVARCLTLLCGDCQGLLKRFASDEARRSADWLMREGHDDIVLMARDLGLKLLVDGRTVRMAVLDYVPLASRCVGPGMQMANRPVAAGKVTLDDTAIVKLYEQLMVQKLLDTRIPGMQKEWVPLWQEARVRECADVLVAWNAYMKSVQGDTTVRLECFPPCMNGILRDVQQGKSGHAPYFALTSFMHAVGMATEDIMKEFEKAPNFRPDMTTYQVESIVSGGDGGGYTPKSCKTMRSDGLCPGTKTCGQQMGHPLEYYRKACASAAKRVASPPTRKVEDDAGEGEYHG
jgi:DNA primase large subunit